MIEKILKNKLLINGIGIILVCVVIAGAYYAGFEKGIQNPKITIVKGVFNMEGKTDENIDFSLFWDAWNILKSKYVDSDKISNKELMYGAISGLMSATKDPFTVFMPPIEANGFNEEIRGEFGGIGAEIGIRQNVLVIVAPLKDSPAEKSGLKSGDKILKINDKDSTNLSVEEAVKRIRGEKGTAVKLMIFRDSFDKPQDFTIIRDTIQVPTLDWKIINSDGKEDKNGGIVYVQLYNFYEKAPMLFYQMAIQALYSNPKGMIIDLRDNPGGYLEASTNIASWFLERGETVVIEKFQSGENQEFKSENSGVFQNIPIVVLINQGSASASEILAGALRDNKNIKLVGVKSFGKGSVQQLEELKDNSQVKITIAHWLTPKGTLIDKNGLVPDYEVEMSDQDFKDKKDSQFNKALDVLKTEINKMANN